MGECRRTLTNFIKDGDISKAQLANKREDLGMGLSTTEVQVRDESE